MRNTNDYPVTKQEILDYLGSLLDDFHDEMKKGLMCGDMRPILISEAMRVVSECYYQWKIDNYENQPSDN